MNKLSKNKKKGGGGHKENKTKQLKSYSCNRDKKKVSKRNKIEEKENKEKKTKKQKQTKLKNHVLKEIHRQFFQCFIVLIN